MSVPRKILCRVAQVPHGKMGQGLAFVIHKGDRLIEKLSLQALLRLSHGKTAYVDAVDVAVGIKCIQRIGIGAKARVGRQQNRQHDAGDQQWPLPTLLDSSFSRFPGWVCISASRIGSIRSPPV